MNSVRRKSAYACAQKGRTMLPQDPSEGFDHECQPQERQHNADKQQNTSSTPKHDQSPSINNPSCDEGVSDTCAESKLSHAHNILRMTSNVSGHQADEHRLCFEFLLELKKLIGDKRFEEWFAQQTRIQLVDRYLNVAVTSPFLQRWMKRVFQKACQQVAMNLFGPGMIVEFIVDDQSATADQAALLKQSQAGVGPALPGVSYQDYLEQLAGEETNLNQHPTSKSNSERFGIEDSKEQEIPIKNLPDMEARGSSDDPAGISSIPNRNAQSGQSVFHDNKVKANSLPSTATGQAQVLHKPNHQMAARKSRAAYSLDSFVTSSSNLELIQSARHLCQQQEHYFHGMYIYGGVGNGKTHLLQGIYGLLRDPQRNLRVMYLTAEQFANYYIHALRDKSIPSFHQKFRQLDAMIVDDVEFLEGKQGIQEEFLRTLKQLEQHRKLVIFSADRHPRSFLQTRSELIDRYLSCLMKRIEQPDDLVRQQIVQQRAIQLNMELTQEVAEYLGKRFRGSIRELIGAVNCLHAYYLVHCKKITLTSARHVLTELERACLRIIRPQDIEQVVCEFFQITLEELHSSSRQRTLSLPRMIAMYLIRKHTTAAYTEIGRQFGGRNHSTVISAERKVGEWLEQDLTIKLERQKASHILDTPWSIRDILQTLEQRLMAC
jgi:chromosomal replication initiator protein